MTKPWRNFAIILFLGAVLFGGMAGDQLLAVSGKDTQAQLRLYTELLEKAHENYGAEVTYKDLVYASIHGMLRTLDPHTSFLTPDDYAEMRERQQESFFGLGILVSVRDGDLTVISPIEGTPAWRMGLRAGDVISNIEGEPTDTMTLDEAVDKLKGPKGTQVNVTIRRRGLEEPLDMDITRAEIPQNSVRYAYMMEPGTGYIRLTDFTRSTAREMKQALDDLKGQGMERLLLDLRSNGGGLLDQTVLVSGLFVPPNARIVETRGRLPESYQTFYAEDGFEPLEMPLVVLVNNGTASAAEILAGAIQDHDMGVVAGTSTWGKGLVQTVYNLSYGSGVALTTAKYYTPSGRLIQRDYSSYYDYYTHFGEPETDDGNSDEPSDEGSPAVILAPGDAPPEIQVAPENEIFYTDLGREVYGGGGIQPDVEIELPDGPSILTALFSRNAFFDFAVDYNARQGIDSTDWTPPADLLDRFRNWVLAEEIVAEEDLAEMLEDEEAREFTVRQIHADIFNSAFGTQEANRVMADGDLQIQEALELFDEAEAQLSSRQELNGDAQVAENQERSDPAAADGGI
ncbi:MAG: S41 family peptidase [Thermoanaerobaculia bacterium]|nr:S41 family peptidase [Thermoanaerobaculia bacterium]